MTRLLRGNREIVVRDEDVAAYLNEGYAVIDNRGNIIAEGKAMDYPAAMKEIERLNAYSSALAKNLKAASERIKELEDDMKMQADRIVELTNERDELARLCQEKQADEEPTEEKPAAASKPKKQTAAK